MNRKKKTQYDSTSNRCVLTQVNGKAIFTPTKSLASLAYYVTIFITRYEFFFCSIGAGTECICLSEKKTHPSKNYLSGSNRAENAKISAI